MDLYESRDSIEFKKAMESFYSIVFATNLNKGLTNAPKERIIKVNWNEDGHPRDENGRFTSGSGSGGSDSTEDGSAGYSSELRKDMDGNYFSRPTLRLPKAEYSKVCSEISTNYSMYEGEKISVHYTATDDGVKSYYFENHGYGDYNIFDKEDS